MPNYYITEGYSKMKITKNQIKKIIQEEIEKLMREVEGIHSREVTQLLDDPSTFTRKTAGGAFDLARSFPGSPYGGAGNEAWYQRNTDKLDQGPEDKSGFVVSPRLPPMTHKEFTGARERGDAVAGSATKAYGKPGRLGVLTPDLKKALQSMKDRVLGSTASKTKGTEKPLSPLKYDPKKHALEENDLDEVERRPVAKSVPAPKGPVKEPAYYRDKRGIEGPDVRYQRWKSTTPGERDPMYREKRNKQGQVTRLTKSGARFNSDFEPVYKPLKYDPKKHAFEENMQIDSRLPPAPMPKKQAPQVPLNRDFEKVFGTEDPLAGLVDPESPIPKELFDRSKIIDRVRAMGRRFKARGKAAEKRPDVNDPKKHALEEDVVSVKDLDLDETSSKARREEQVNETDETPFEKKQKAIKTYQQLPHKTAEREKADQQRKNQKDAYRQQHIARKKQGHRR